jgi:hypothetical protein
VLSNIIPAAGFTAATTAPATLGSALDVLDFLGHHLVWFGGALTAVCLVLVVWSSTREAARQDSINAADREWSATGRPVQGWGPGWAWSGWEPAEDEQEPGEAAGNAALVAADPVEVRPFRPSAEARSAICGACKGALATTTVTYADGTEFRVCDRCAPSGVELDVPSTFGRAS